MNGCCTMMCSMTFTEVLTWTKEGVDQAWKGRIMKHLYWGPNTSAPYTSTRSDEFMATPGANIRVPPWPPPFTARGGRGVITVWKINLSRGQLKSKKGRLMRTSLLWIQPRLFVGVGVRLIFRTAGKHLLATVVTASYGFQFGTSTTPWKDHQVYFETDPASCGYLIRVGHNH
jgi:hypothetical protein